MTTIYMIRHAESDRTVKNGSIRPLTAKGLKDAQELVTRFRGIALDKIYSSPYRRAVDTVLPLARSRNLQIQLVEDFRERKSDSVQTMEREALTRKQWNDFTFTLSDGECFEEVQRRNLQALQKLLIIDRDRSLAIGTHGVALCTILQYYRPMDETEFQRILARIPYVAALSFDADRLIGFQEIHC